MPTPTPAQQRAIAADPGPVLVVAGPGAGKTFCLIERIHHLVSTHAITPDRICAVTFTNKAANEMRHRLRDRLGEAAEHITGGTLHALCAQILRERGEAVRVPRGFGIADEPYQLQVLRRLRVPERRARQLLRLFEQARFQGYALTDGDERLLSQYETVLVERQLLDFDQLVAKTAELFRRFPVAAEEVSDRWSAILVDEFQDLDRKQYQVIKALAEGHRNVFVVGDDEQSIFTWRGAEPVILQLFARDFGVTPIVLDRNLRSARPIFEVARRLVEGNEGLFDKQIVAERESPFPVVAMDFADAAEEAGWIVRDLLADRATSGLPYSEYAVLFRQHRHADPLERAMLKAGIPCRFARGRALRDDEVIGYVIGALRIALNPDDPDLLTLFAESQLPKRLLNRVRAAAPDGAILAQLRAFAESAGRDADTRRAWRFIYHVENLGSAVRAHASLDALVDRLIALKVRSWENRLERESDRLLDPLDDPAARTLAEKIGDSAVVVELGGLEIPLNSMLSRARGTSRPRPRVHASTRPRVLLDPSDAGKDGLPLTLFRALQLRDTRHLGEAFGRYVTFDLETTDNDTDTCEIVEIGAARVVDGEIVERFQQLIRPEGAISARATAVHGLQAKDVADAPDFTEAWTPFRAFVGDDLLVAHNAHGFDFPVLRRLAKGLPGSEGLRVFDTLPLARAVSPGSARLADLAVRFGVDPGTSHRALDDAVTLAQVFPRLEALRIQRSRKSAHAALLDDLALAIALDPAERTDQAALYHDLGRTVALGPYSRCLETWGETREITEAIELLGGRELMERLRRERSPEDLYPEAVERLRGLLDVPGDTIQEQMQRFLEVVALSRSAGEVELDPHAVNLLTLHATKGLEFSRVYVVGVEDYTLPGYYAFQDKKKAEIEEGRRLLYVGMTRARDRLVLTRTQQRAGRESGGSMFLTEMNLVSGSPSGHPMSPP